MAQINTPKVMSRASRDEQLRTFLSIVNVDDGAGADKVLIDGTGIGVNLSAPAAPLSSAPVSSGGVVQAWYTEDEGRAFTLSAPSNGDPNAPWIFDTINSFLFQADTLDALEVTPTANVTVHRQLAVSGTLYADTFVATDQVRTRGGNELILNAGESHNYAAGQGGEYVYLNAENGLMINSSPDNWASGWAGRQTAFICDANGRTSLPGRLDVDGEIHASSLIWTLGVRADSPYFVQSDTDAPIGLLRAVDSGGNNAGQLAAYNFDGVGGATQWRFQTSISDVLFQQDIRTEGDLAVDGRVGIGTTSPITLLEMEDADPVLTLNDTSGSGNSVTAYIQGLRNGTSAFLLGMNTTQARLTLLNAMAGGEIRLEGATGATVVDESGQMTIANTSAPRAAMDVRGGGLVIESAGARVFGVSEIYRSEVLTVSINSQVSWAPLSIWDTADQISEFAVTSESLGVITLNKSYSYLITLILPFECELGTARSCIEVRGELLFDSTPPWMPISSRGFYALGYARTANNGYGTTTFQGYIPRTMFLSSGSVEFRVVAKLKSGSDLVALGGPGSTLKIEVSTK